MLEIDYNLKHAIHPNALVGLWRLMKGYHLKYISATVCIGLAAAAKALTYLLLRYLVNNYFVSPSAAISLPVIALGFILLASLEGGMTFLGGKLTAETAEGTTRRLRNFLYDHVQRLPFSYHNQADTGELIEKCTSDVDALRRFYADQAISVGRIILLFVINFIALINLNLQLGLASVIVVPLILAVSIFFFRRVSKAYEVYQEQEAILSTTLQENLSGVRVVKAFARQSYESQKFQKDNYEKFIRGRKLITMHSLFWPISDAICGFQLLSGFLYAALLVMSGSMTIGDYLAYAGLVVWILFPLRNLGRVIVQTSTGLVSYRRVVSIMEQPVEPLDDGEYIQSGPIKGEIEFKEVGFTYQEGNTALSDINFVCKPGQVVALLGSTGSGKTTLINLIPRFFEYTSGQVLLDGIDLNQYSRRFLRENIGIVEQEPFLFSRTIRENITYGISRDISPHEIEGAARAAAVHDVILTFPESYQTMVGERGVTLSGGQKQRIAIARALLKNPGILILDDSTSSVDTDTEEEIRQAARELMKNRTTFIIAHRISSIINADLILVMDGGRIVQHGTHDELVTQPGIYRKIFDIQALIETELEKEISID